MKNTEIGFMPDEWMLSSIGREFSIQQGKQVSKKNRIGSNQRKFLRTANVFWYGLDMTVLDEMHFTKVEEEKLTLLKDDILICEGGDIGRTTICQSDLPGIFYQNHLFRLRPKNGEIDPTFFALWMNFFVRFTEHYGAAGNKTTIPNLSKSRLESFLFPKPPISEQFNISKTLCLIKSAIQKQEALIQTTTELKNALMEKLFSEGIRGEMLKETEIGMVPKSWEIVELKKAGEVIYGIQAAVANNTEPIGTKILTNINISLDGKIDLTKVRYYQLKSKRDFNTILQKGDILFNWRSGSKEHVGKTGLFNLDGEYTHSSFILRIRLNRTIDNYFLYLYLNHLRSTGYFIKQQTYSINAKFNKSAIEVLPVSLPSLKEQTAISETIWSVDEKLNHHLMKKQFLRELSNSMLQKLMTGEIRVNDIDFNKEYRLKHEPLNIAAEI